MGHCRIRGRSGKLISLTENSIQTALLDKAEAQAAAGLPVRLIVPKARKVGISTAVTGLLRYLAKNVPTWHSYIAAHTIDSTQDIFEIARRIEKHDSEGSGQRVGTAKALKYDNDSKFTCATAGGHYIGSGSTINALLLSEVPKWQGSASTIKDQLLSLLNSVPDDPNSIVVIEATANRVDPSGDFEARCRAAERGEGDYALVFGPWFQELTYRTPGPPLGPYSADEQRLVDVFKLSDEQLRWRRRTIVNNCAGDITRFKQDFPATLDEAFTVAEGRIFPMLRREVHHRHFDNCTEWECYRGVDWGGWHPFVCQWIAHRRDQPPGFTIDIEQCPRTWQGLTGWSRDDKQKPSERFKDLIDPLRYACVTFSLTGHVHVYREYVVNDSAALGKSELDLAEDIKHLTHEHIVCTVADRSRPNSINLFNQRQVPTIPMQQPSTTIGGEVEDGIGHLHGLMVATTPFSIERPGPSTAQRLIHLRDNSSIPFTVGLDMSLEMERHRDVNRSYVHPFLGDCY